MHPKFDSAGVRTHNLKIMTVHFTPGDDIILTIWQSGTSLGPQWLEGCEFETKQADNGMGSVNSFVRNELIQTS